MSASYLFREGPGVAGLSGFCWEIFQVAKALITEAIALTNAENMATYAAVSGLMLWASSRQGLMSQA